MKVIDGITVAQVVEWERGNPVVVRPGFASRSVAEVPPPAGFLTVVGKKPIRFIGGGPLNNPKCGIAQVDGSHFIALTDDRQLPLFFGELRPLCRNKSSIRHPVSNAA